MLFEACGVVLLRSRSNRWIPDTYHGLIEMRRRSSIVPPRRGSPYIYQKIAEILATVYRYDLETWLTNYIIIPPPGIDHLVVHHGAMVPKVVKSRTCQRMAYARIIENVSVPSEVEDTFQYETLVQKSCTQTFEPDRLGENALSSWKQGGAGKRKEWQRTPFVNIIREKNLACRIRVDKIHLWVRNTMT